MLEEQTAKLTGTQASFKIEEKQKATTVVSGSVNLRNCEALVNGAGEGLSRAVKQKLDIGETAFSTIGFNPIAVLDVIPTHKNLLITGRQAVSIHRTSKFRRTTVVRFPAILCTRPLM